MGSDDGEAVRAIDLVTDISGGRTVMAITRIHQTGFESGQVEYEAADGTGTIATTQYTGTYSLSVFSTAYHLAWFITSTSQVRGGFFFRTPGVTSGTPCLFALYSGATQAIRLNYDGTTLTLLAGATTLDTYTFTFSTNVWYHIGFDIKLDGAAGWANIYINGTEQLAFSGDTNDGASTCTKFYLGTITGAQWGTTTYMDDFYLDDTTGEGAPAAPPLKRFYYMLPSGDGNYSQWDGSDGNSVNNYALVDERPPNELTDYVYTSTSTDRDSYAMADPSLGAGETVVAVIPQAIVRNVGGGGTLKLSTRLSGTDVDSAAKNVGVDWGLIWDRQTTKPGGGSWSASDVNNTEVGITQP